jgi:hypothetical protein
METPLTKTLCIITSVTHAFLQVAKFLKTVHHEFLFTVEEGLDAICDVVYHLETYDVTSVRAATPMYLMSRKIKALGVKMVRACIFDSTCILRRCPYLLRFSFAATGSFR